MTKKTSVMDTRLTEQATTESASFAYIDWPKFLSGVCYALILAILLLLFIENFVFSAGYELLRFREVDDVAFQTSLRQFHLAIENVRLHRMLWFNHYAYGWIYWASMALITYPFYILSVHYGIDWPLIVAPRQLSLLFAVLSLFILRKILIKNGAPQWAVAVALLIFTLFPTFGYFSLRFGTVNAVMFFSVLSFYLAQRNDPSTARGRLSVAVSLAIAGGIKLSGLFIAPLVFALVLIRHQDKSYIGKFRDLFRFVFVFLFLLVLFSNPVLFVAPFFPKIAVGYWETLNHFMAVPKIAAGSQNPVQRLFDAVFGSKINAVVIFVLLAGMAIYYSVNRRVRPDFAAIFFTIFITVLYLFISVKNGTSAGIYITSISFLVLTGVAGLSRGQSGRVILYLLPVILLIDLSMRAKSQYENQSGLWNHFNYFINSIKSKPDLQLAEDVDKCIGVSGNRNWSGHVFLDYTLPTGLNALRYPQACISVVWGKLSAQQSKICEGSPIDYSVVDTQPLAALLAFKFNEKLRIVNPKLDYLVLDKQSTGALSAFAFDEKLRTVDPKLKGALLEDRAARAELNQTGFFNNQSFAVICENERVKVFKAIN